MPRVPVTEFTVFSETVDLPEDFIDDANQTTLRWFVEPLTNRTRWLKAADDFKTIAINSINARLGIRTRLVADASALRSVSAVGLIEGEVAVTQSAPLGLWLWAATVNEPEGEGIVRPSSVGTGSPGRWVSIRWLSSAIAIGAGNFHQALQVARHESLSFAINAIASWVANYMSTLQPILIQAEGLGSLGAQRSAALNALGTGQWFGRGRCDSLYPGGFAGFKSFEWSVFNGDLDEQSRPLVNTLFSGWSNGDNTHPANVRFYLANGQQVLMTGSSSPNNTEPWVRIGGGSTDRGVHVFVPLYVDYVWMRIG